MGKAVRTQYLDPERLTGSPPSQLWNKHLLTVDRSKELPKLQQNLAFWRRKKRIAITILLVLIVLVAGTVVGVVVAVSKKHHVDQSSPSGAPSSANASSPTGSTPFPTSSSSSAPGSISTGQPIPSTLATTFKSASWIWQGTQARINIPSGDWAFRKTLPTSASPAKLAAVLLAVNNSFILYHNGQLIAASSTTDGCEWEIATAIQVNLDPNSNVFAIQAHNSPPEDPDIPGGTAAGLLVTIQISYADGTTASISSDATWRVTQPVPDGFQSPLFDDTQWPSATILGTYGCSPWDDTVVTPLSLNVTTR
ncbi:hypothetical protein BD779DRAFT_1701489 [Infundibulicybe gibba]|nr:hypothetical protein BD779DRAFT_1701489 [Infundibulicybe gibba]